MELAELVQSLQVVEVTVESRVAAIRQMVRAVDWQDPDFQQEELLAAVEEREATAQTVVAARFALPHAVVNWSGRYRLVLGRSRTGVAYGIPGSDRVHLIALLVIGKDNRHQHLELLAAVAELFRSEEFREAVIAATTSAAIELLLRQRAGIQGEPRTSRLPGQQRLNAIFLEQAIQLGHALSAQALLLAVDRLQNVPWKPLASWSGRLLIVAAASGDEPLADRPQTHLFDVPHTGLSRADRANLGLLLAASSGLLEETAWVVCVTGPEGQQLDSITMTRPESHWRSMFPAGDARGKDYIRPEVLLRVLSLAIDLATEGREGRPVGTMFVVGDHRTVLRYAQQIVLNPFHGFARSLRNLLDPSLGETIKEFAQIDGAFIVHSDGTVQSAGTYLAPKPAPYRLPPGLGTRHTTAAAITAHTAAMAVTVSQSTGTVTVFRRGKIILKLQRAAKTRW